MSSYVGNGKRTLRYETIAVTALLTEWTNVFYNPNGSEDGGPWWNFERCPAILVQELIGAEVHECVPAGNGFAGGIFFRPSDLKADEVRATRTVFASIGEFGDLEPVMLDAVTCRGYLGTVPGGALDEAAQADLLKSAIKNGYVTQRDGEPI